jgi:hypothetical protein
VSCIDNDLVVARDADVELEHVRAGTQRLAERVHRVGGELVLAALVRDVERRLLLDPAVGGARGRGRDEGEGGDERAEQGAAHGRGD